MNEISKRILSLVSNSLFHVKTGIKLDEEIIAEAKRQAVWGLVDRKAYMEYANNVNIMHAHALLTEYLNGIPFTTIKGYASAYYYPIPLTRTLGDVDFLVDASYYDIAEKKLLKAGFRPHHSTNIHRCYWKDGMLFEMHFEVNGIPDNEREQAVRLLLTDTIATSRVVLTTEGESIIIPDDFHNGLICLLHIMSHMRNSGIGLRHFCDWACLVNRVPGFEAVFKERFERIGLWKCAQLFSLAAVKYLGIPYQQWMGEADESILESLIEEVISSGNFGRCREIQTSNWFFDKKRAKSKLFGLFSTLNQVVRIRWPIAPKIPLLYLVGWFYFPARYFIRVCIGKRDSIQLKEAIKMAERKNKLIRAMCLFK